MNGLCLHASSLAHTFRCTPSRSGKQNSHSSRLISCDNTLRSSGFSGTGTAGKYHHLRAYRLFYSGYLHFIVLYARHLFYSLNISFQSEEGRRLVLQQSQQLIRRSTLRVIERRQINSFVLTDKIFRSNHLSDGLPDRFFIGFEQLLCGFY